MTQLDALISKHSYYIYIYIYIYIFFFFFPNHRNVPDTCLGVETVKIRDSTSENNEISSFLSLAYQVQPIPEKKEKMLN